MEKKFRRSVTDKKIAGVCGGIGEYLDVDPVIWRILFVSLTFFGGSGLLIYLILLFIMPDGDNKTYTQYEEINESPTNNTSQATADEPTHTVQDDIKEHISQNKDTISKTVTSVFGIVLIFLGAIFLFHNFFPDFNFKYYFPVLLVIAGFLLLVIGFKNKNK